MIKSKNVKIRETKQGLVKTASYSNYNYSFRIRDGLFVRWGKTLKEDPQVAPAPEILDIEISTKCANGCNFCYKSNTSNGKNMSLDTFKKVLDKFPNNLTQIAIGSDSSGISNPDIFSMMQYARKNGIVPNITVADITKDTAERLAEVTGAVAVSRYKDKNKCYNSVKYLLDAGLNHKIYVKKYT